MQAAHTCAGARQATWAATARSRWTSVYLTHVTMVQPVLITWVDTPARYEVTHTALYITERPVAHRVENRIVKQINAAVKFTE